MSVLHRNYLLLFFDNNIINIDFFAVLPKTLDLIKSTLLLEKNVNYTACIVKANPLTAFALNVMRLLTCL